jgi:predicted nuclease of predicted toxin-antitoxin system
MRLLLDAHISPDVAEQVRNVGLEAFSLRDWRGGEFYRAVDEVILREASSAEMVLVTYDLATVPMLLKDWAETGRSHAGVVLVDQRTVRQSDIGGQVRGLLSLAAAELNFTNRVEFLHRT